MIVLSQYIGTFSQLVNIPQRYLSNLMKELFVYLNMILADAVPAWN